MNENADRWRRTKLRATSIRIAAAFGVAALIAILNAIRVVPAQPVTGQFLYAAETLFVLLPFAAGFSVASLRKPTRRSALLIAGVTSLAMVGVDLLPSSGELWHRNRLVQMKETGQWVSTEVKSRWNAANGVATVHAHLTGGIDAEDDSDVRYPGGPEWHIGRAYMKVVLLPLPLAVVGLVLGLLRVLRRGILFKSRGVELAAEFVVGWGGTALIVWVVMGITDSLEAVIGSGRARPVYLAVPVATALLISLAGWLPSREID